MNDITSEKSYEKIKSIDDANSTIEEVSKDNKYESIEREKSVNINGQKVNGKRINNGEIVVTSLLDCGEHEKLQGVKINLYKINGLSPILIEYKVTNEDGKATFSEIDDGCYRIIEIIDKRYFEKPKYVSWNEIIIDSNNKKQNVVIINKLKKGIALNKHSN